jgi:hypothetical protein
MLGGQHQRRKIMSKKKDEKPTVVEQEKNGSVDELPEETKYDPRLLFFVDLINNVIETGWLNENPEIVEKGIKLFTQPTPKYSKQQTYALKKLQEEGYEKSLETGQPVEPISEEQIFAEMDRMEKAKQSKKSKKSEVKIA